MIENILKRFGFLHKEQVKMIFDNYRKKTRADFSAASTGNLYSGWTNTNYSADQILRMDLSTLRARSRELERNNVYAKKVFGIIERKVIGKGFTLQARTHDASGKLHKNDNNLIENKFREWSKKVNCDSTAQHTFRDITKSIVRHVMRDGEIIIRKIRFADNPFAYTLQLIEADHLDEKHNETLTNGNKIKMGIEFDLSGRPVAYHLLTEHPGDYFFAQRAYSKRIRIPAEDIIHLYIKNRISASRGIPVIHAAMIEMNMGGGYMESEMVAARVAAAQMGFITNEEGETTKVLSDDMENSDGTGNALFDAEPGTFRELGPGQTVSSYAPEHPTTQFADFMKFIIRAIGSGSDVPFNTLANDYSDVNYSSLRAAEVEQRDVWYDLQIWLTEHFLTPNYDDWLLMSLTSGALPVKFTMLEKFKSVIWLPRGYSWVNPKEEAASNSVAILNRIKSPQQIIIETGGDPEQVLDDFEDWNKMLEDRNLSTKPEAEINKLVSESLKDEKIEN